MRYHLLLYANVIVFAYYWFDNKCMVTYSVFTFIITICFLHHYCNYANECAQLLTFRNSFFGKNCFKKVNHFWSDNN